MPNSGTSKTSRRAALGMTAAVAISAIVTGASSASAQQTTIKFMMDWAWQGPQAFALIAQKKGYFKDEGLTVQLDRGFGSGRVPVELAAGTYQMGFADINPMIKFVAEKPETGIVAVAVVYDGGAQAVIVDAKGPIKTPKDLEGKTLAAPDADGARQLFPAFAKLAGIDASKVNWMSVKPELREPMLAQGQAQGITGFITSAAPSLDKIGFGKDRQKVMMYSEFGAPFYSTSIMTTKKFAEENPKAVAGVTRALLRGLQDALKNPEEAITILKEHEPLTEGPVEKGRWLMAANMLIATPYARANGISAVDPARMQRAISLIEEAYGMPAKLKVDDVYTAKFLPEAAVRAVPAVPTN
jgi:NitT/TauT family transport system substrate-binding protein